MQTLSYGQKLPELNDSGDALWTALEDNITRVDAHTHNGVNSAALSATAVLAVSNTAPSGSWVASGATGHYRQSVTLPAGFSYDTVQIGVRTSAGIVVYPTIEKISATQFYVYTIDNTQTFTIVYGG